MSTKKILSLQWKYKSGNLNNGRQMFSALRHDWTSEQMEVVIEMKHVLISSIISSKGSLCNNKHLYKIFVHKI